MGETPQPQSRDPRCGRSASVQCTVFSLMRVPASVTCCERSSIYDMPSQSECGARLSTSPRRALRPLGEFPTPSSG